jgi:hypothetical protein
VGVLLVPVADWNAWKGVLWLTPVNVRAPAVTSDVADRVTVTVLVPAVGASKYHISTRASVPLLAAPPVTCVRL